MKTITGIITFVVVLALIGGTFTALRYGCLWGDTVMERKVYEESYQRSEALKARIATDEAVLAEIQVQLGSTDLEPSTRLNLEAQARAARVRIATAKSQQ